MPFRYRARLIPIACDRLLASEGDSKVAAIAYCIDKHVHANQSLELLADFRDKSKSDQLSPEYQDIIIRLVRECFE